MDWWKTIEIHLPSSMMIGTRLIACWLTIKKINQRTSFRLWVLLLYSIACRLFIIHKIKKYKSIFGSWVVVCLSELHLDQFRAGIWAAKNPGRPGRPGAIPGIVGKPGYIDFFNHLLFKLIPINSYKWFVLELQIKKKG